MVIEMPCVSTVLRDLVAPVAGVSDFDWSYTAMRPSNTAVFDSSGPMVHFLRVAAVPSPVPEATETQSRDGGGPALVAGCRSSLEPTRAERGAAVAVDDRPLG